MDKFVLDALASSGIVFPDESAANAAGFFEFTADHATQYGFKTFGHGLLIKYPDLSGTMQPRFARVRYTTPLTPFKAKRPIRYLQPKDSLPQLYFPNCGPKTWLDIAADPAVTICITEGEKKAYASQSMLGIPTIGLGGVTSFAMRKLDAQPLLPEFETINLRGRKIYIAYDSDIAENVNVERAELVLAEALSDKGANVYFVRLPPSPDGKKQGLDDCIVNMGVDITGMYFTDAEPYTNAKALAEFGKKCYYIRKLGAYLDLATGNVVDPKRAASSYYANVMYLRKSLNKKGEPVIERANLFNDYNKWPARNEFSNMINEPGKPRVTDDNEYNLWADTAIAPEEGSVAEYLDFCSYFFEDDPIMEKYWHDWVATMVQNPGVKMQTAWLLVSNQTGTGKTLMARLVGRMFGEAFIEGHSELLTDERNDWVIGKQLALIDDLNDYVGRKDGARIRSLITRGSVHINPKFQQPYDVVDHVNIIITTNEDVSVKVENTDRRFFIARAPEARAPDTVYATMHAFLKSNARMANLRCFYLGYSISEDFHYATRPPEDTKALMEAKQLSASDHTAFADWLVAKDSPIPKSITVMSTRDLNTLYNMHNPTFRAIATYRSSKVTRRLTLLGLRCLDYRGGVHDDTGVNSSLFWVGPHANASKQAGTSPKDLQALYDEQTAARTQFLQESSSLKF